MSEPTSDDPLPTFSLPAEAGESIADLPTLGGPSSGDNEPVPRVPGYEIRGILGRGGMGIVYRALQVGLGREVALKVMRTGVQSPTDRARFEREAGVTARLPLPGIVQVYDIGTYGDDKRCFVAFELVEGLSLDQYLHRHFLTPAQAADLTASLARTMQAVHERKVLHRDLKPANVLLGGERRDVSPPVDHTASGDALHWRADAAPLALLSAKITDFGLAYLLDQDGGLTRAGQVLGTPNYMAPEQLDRSRGELGPATDVYALGAILYECLTGRPPFKGACLAETLAQLTHHDPVAVRRLRPDVPRDLETICLKCLSKEPARRYGSAKELADDLDRFREGKPIKARPLSLVGHAYRAARRRPGTAALVVSLVLALLSIPLLTAWYLTRLAAQREATQAALADAHTHHLQATSNEYHLLTSRASQEAARLDVGRSTRALETLRAAAALDTPLRDFVRLRSQAAECLGSFDIRDAGELSAGFVASHLAFHPSRSVLAVGQAKAWPWMSCRVVLLEVPSGKELHRFTFAPAALWKDKRTVQDGVTALAFSPDGRWLVAGSRAGAIYRWDLQQPNARPLTWPAHTGAVKYLCCDESAAFSVGSDRLLRRWNLAEGGKATHEMPCIAQPILAAGELLAADDERVHYLRPADLTPLRSPITMDATRLTALPRSAMAAVSSGPAVWLFDRATGQKRLDLRRGGLPAHDGSVDALALRPSGCLLATASSQHRHVRIWDTTSAQLVTELSLLDGDCQLAFDATGSTLAILASKQVRLLSIQPCIVQTHLALHPRTVHAAAWVNGGTELACISGERWGTEGEASIWPTGGGPPRVRRTIPLPEARLPMRMKLDTSGKHLAWTEDGFLTLNRVSDLGEQARVKVTDVQGLSFTAETLWIAFALKVQAFRGEALKRVAWWDNVAGDQFSGVGNLWCVAAGPTHTVVGSKDGTVRVLSAKGELKGTHRLGVGPVCRIALCADESWAIAGMWDGQLRLLHLRDGQVIEVPQAHRDRVTAVALLPAGRVVTASSDGTLRLWQWEAANLTSVLALPLGGPIADVSVTPDGQRLAVVLEGERAVRVWHLDQLANRLADLGM